MISDISSPSIDPVWEEKYSSGHAELYPWDSIVTFIYRYFPKNKLRSSINILEVGCGTGSNLWFAAREGFNAFGVEASASAVAFANSRIASDGLQAQIIQGDFVSLPFPDNHFDLVFDRGSIVCCDLDSGQKAVNEVYRVLRPAGYFFFNPYSDFHSSRSSGVTAPNGLTTSISEGSMVGVGQICFYSRDQVEKTLSSFCIESLEHLQITNVCRPGHSVHAEWRAIASKPS